MKTTIIQKFTLILVLFFAFSGCNKETPCFNNEQFCSYIEVQDFSGSESIINNYLSDLKSNKPDENLNKLADWLRCKSCVENVEISCNSCIETSPPQSELTIVFNSKNQQVTKTLDVIMDKKLKARGFH